MKIEIVHVCRRPPWPLWAVLLVFVWSGLGAGAVWLAGYLHQPIELCPLKRVTGFPCPTCGFTRGALSFLHGHVGQAWLYNPLLYSVLALFFAATAARVIFARSVRIRLAGTERSIAWFAGVALFFANWAYVILCVG